MGVRVNAINPSLVLTPRFERRFEEEARQANTGKIKLVSDLSKNIPLRRYAQASEIADIALFLGSARSSYISGAVISADAAYRPSL
jgi:NAD(P)-dependent dehydrogenase (short-subunit alcohol dehydrogenase family)